MGAMAFVGVVTKVGVMNKTATVTVPRLVIHKPTGKVCGLWCSVVIADGFLFLQRLERSTKILTHDENNGLSRRG
jgi:small subunit ribosomal protein S17